MPSAYGGMCILYKAIGSSDAFVISLSLYFYVETYIKI